MHAQPPPTLDPVWLLERVSCVSSCVMCRGGGTGGGGCGTGGAARRGGATINQTTDVLCAVFASVKGVCVELECCELEAIGDDTDDMRDW
jgi:hypothetical protein